MICLVLVSHATFHYSLAEFKETESTCGAATCTVTAIEGGADNEWTGASDKMGPLRGGTPHHTDPC